MKVVQIQLFTFDELDEKAKALDRKRRYVDYDWWNALYNDAGEAGLTMNGFDFDSYIKIAFTSDAVYTAGKVTDHHGSETATFLTTKDFWEKRDKLLSGWTKDAYKVFLRSDELENDIKELENAYLNAIGKGYLRPLVRECDYLTSDNSIAETLIINEYHFTADSEVATHIERMAEQLPTSNSIKTRFKSDFLAKNLSGSIVVPWQLNSGV